MDGGGWQFFDTSDGDPNLDGWSGVRLDVNLLLVNTDVDEAFTIFLGHVLKEILVTLHRGFIVTTGSSLLADSHILLKDCFGLFLQDGPCLAD